MSFKAVQWALTSARPEPHPEVKAHVQQHVLVGLASYASDLDRQTGEHTGVYVCWVGIPKLADGLQMSERTVQRALRALIAQGLVTAELRSRANGSRTTSLYRLAVPARHQGGDSLAPAPTDSEHEAGGSLAPPEPLLPNLSDEPLALVTERNGSKRARPRDELFEAVAEACGIDWTSLTKSARGPLNRAVSELRQVEATPEEVHRRAAEYHRRWSVELTPSALAKHWPNLGSRAPLRQTPAGMHSTDQGTMLALERARQREEAQRGGPASRRVGEPSALGLPSGSDADGDP